MTAGERFPRAGRLVRPAELERVARRGRRSRLPHLDVVWLDSEAGHPRLGLIVARFQSTAVARNRLRRRLREIWRRQLQSGMGPVDVVIRARREAYHADFHMLRAELVGWVTVLNPAL